MNFKDGFKEAGIKIKYKKDNLFDLNDKTYQCQIYAQHMFWDLWKAYLKPEEIKVVADRFSKLVEIYNKNKNIYDVMEFLENEYYEKC